MARMYRFLAVFSTLMVSQILLAQRDTDPAAGCASCGACGGCGLFVIVIPIALLALHIILLVWVARDAKARGMDNSVIWMILVFVVGVVGLIIYIFARTQGNLVQCPSCHGKRLQVSAKCPQCGNA